MQCPEKCRNCQRLHHCAIRVREWVKNIEILMSKKHEKGDGERMAEEIINYMNNDFMGGINAK